MMPFIASLLSALAMGVPVTCERDLSYTYDVPAQPFEIIAGLYFWPPNPRIVIDVRMCRGIKYSLRNGTGIRAGNRVLQGAAWHTFAHEVGHHTGIVDETQADVYGEEHDYDFMIQAGVRPRIARAIDNAYDGLVS